MPIRLICCLVALAQFLWLAPPVQAQGYPNFWPSPGTLGYYNGRGGVYVPRGAYGAQYGYSAASRYRAHSNGMGMAIGLGMYGGMMGVGALMMGSQMISRHKMMKQYNANSQGGGSGGSVSGKASSPKDKLAKADRRRSQELKLKGELDSDYQKELAERNIAPATGPVASMPPSFGSGAPSFGSAPQSFGSAPQSIASPPGAGQPMQPFAGGQSFGAGAPQAIAPASMPAMGGAAPGPTGSAPPAEIFNPTPWTPNSD